MLNSSVTFQLPATETCPTISTGIVPVRQSLIFSSSYSLEPQSNHFSSWLRTIILFSNKCSRYPTASCLISCVLIVACSPLLKLCSSSFFPSHLTSLMVFILSIHWGLLRIDLHSRQRSWAPDLFFQLFSLPFPTWFSNSLTYAIWISNFLLHTWSPFNLL